MKTLILKIDKESLNLSPPDKERSPIDLATSLVKNVILNWGIQKHKGLPEEARRKYYKICDVFDVAIKDNLESVELEDDWMGLIRKAFKEANLVPDKLLRQVEDLVNEVKNR